MIQQEVRQGVQQGSVLRPMLFSLFLFFFFDISINDLLLQIKTVQLNMYAEDAYGSLHTCNTYLVSLEGSFFT